MYLTTPVKLFHVVGTTDISVYCNGMHTTEGPIVISPATDTSLGVRKLYINCAM